MCQVVGAARRQIRMQFLTESVVVSLAALVFGGMVFGWLLDAFNNLWSIQSMRARVVVEPQDVELGAIFGVFGVLVGLLAGVYPALVMSATVRSQVIKGTVALENKRFALRKTLIITQFVFSFIFVTTTLLSYLQVNHTIETDLGFNQKDLINVERFDVSYDVLRKCPAPAHFRSRSVRALQLDGKWESPGCLDGFRSSAQPEEGLPDLY